MLFKFLDETDIIKATDLCRALYMMNWYTGSDYCDGDSEHKIINWCPAAEFMPPWVGKTLEQYYTAQGGKKFPLEVIRPIVSERNEL